MKSCTKQRVRICQKLSITSETQKQLIMYSKSLYFGMQISYLLSYSATLGKGRLHFPSIILRHIKIFQDL